MKSVLPKTCLLYLALLCISSSLFAQDRPLRRGYTSALYNETLALTDTLLASYLPQLERLSNEAYYDANAEVITIPVVFHVLYTSPFDQLSADQITSQLDQLNRDFSAAAIPEEDERDFNDYRSLAADTRIRFCLPTTDPLGVPTTGVNFRLAPLGVLNDLTAIKQEVLGLLPWDGQRYLNIWVSPLPDGNGGFAQLPGGGLLTDGIVIDPRYLGSGGRSEVSYDQGKTLTHLIGTYLGLKELWGESSCSDDGVSDTPVHNSPNYGMPGPGHISTCDGNPLEMVMNFMDNCDDESMYMFTKGQIKRMRAVLSDEGPRSLLASVETQCGEPESITVPEITEEESEEVVEDIELELRLAPNPTLGEVHLNLLLPESKRGRLEIFNTRGNLVYDLPLLGTRTEQLLDINAGKWSGGVYFVRLTADGRTTVKRLTVQ